MSKPEELRQLADKFSEGWHEGIKIDAMDVMLLSDAASELETMQAILTQQPAQATQAEVTDGIRPEDFTVDVVVKPMGGFAPVNTPGVRVTHKPTGISVTCDVARSQHTNRNQAFEKLRAILALRPERVPMTDEEIGYWYSRTPSNFVFSHFKAAIRSAEAHHGIKAPRSQVTPNQ